MKKTPEPWRKKRDGKAYGCWWVTVDRVDINLNTKSAEIAHRRLAEAMRGKRKGWPSDAELAAAAMEETPPATLVQESAPPPAPAPAPPATAAPATAAPADQGGARPPLLPTAEEARAEAAATNEAAQETRGAAANDNAAPQVGPAPFMGTEAIRGLLLQGAAAIVEGQLMLQAWLVHRKTGKIAPTLAPDSPLRTVAAEAWVQQFEIWFPDMSRVPPWIMAVAMPALALPSMFVAAQDPPPQQQRGPAVQDAETVPPVQQPMQAAA